MKFARKISQLIIGGTFGGIATLGLISLGITPQSSMATAVRLAQALSPEEVNLRAKQIIVRIDGASVGSGSILEYSDGVYTVLSNWHVMKNQGDYTVQTIDGRKHQVNPQSIKQLPGLDLAVFEFNSTQNYQTAELGDSGSLGEGQNIYFAGYPGELRREDNRYYRFFSASLVGILPRATENGYSLIYNGEAFPGMSGGPVFNAEGLMIGIHGEANVHALSGGTSNYAIPINAYQGAIAKLNSVPKSGDNPAPPQEEVVAQTEPQPQELSQEEKDVTTQPESQPQEPPQAESQEEKSGSSETGELNTENISSVPTFSEKSESPEGEEQDVAEGEPEPEPEGEEQDVAESESEPEEPVAVESESKPEEIEEQDVAEKEPESAPQPELAETEIQPTSEAENTPPPESEPAEVTSADAEESEEVANVPQTEVASEESDSEVVASETVELEEVVVPTITRKIALVSPRTGIDYTKLRNLLRDEKFSEADIHTYRLVEQVVKSAKQQNKHVFIELKTIAEFSCPDIRTVDYLWKKYSDEKFGFSPQQKVWRSVNQKGDFSTQTWRRFATEVGWKEGEVASSGGYLLYDQLDFEPAQAPPGHLPWWFALPEEEQKVIKYLFARCNLNPTVAELEAEARGNKPKPENADDNQGNVRNNNGNGRQGNNDRQNSP